MNYFQLKISFLLLTLLSTNLLSEVIDFGIQGAQYTIVEKNGNELIQEKIRDLNYTAIEESLHKEALSLFTSRQNIPKSFIDNVETKEDLVRARWNILDFDGNILYEKGEYIPSILPSGAKLEICFIDASLDEKIVDRIIKDFGRECIYMVNNINSYKFSKEYDLQAFPIGGQNNIYLERFNINILPTKVTKIGNEITKQTLSIKRLTLEECE